RMTEANHLEYLRGCYFENRLSKRKAKFGGRTLDLSKITIPVYHLATREDHIAPAKSVFIDATRPANMCGCATDADGNRKDAGTQMSKMEIGDAATVMLAPQSSLPRDYLLRLLTVCPSFR